MGYTLDLKGKKFGKLTVLEYAGKCRSNKTLWLAECECGDRKTYRTGNLMAGITMQCKACVNVTHGHTRRAVMNGKNSPTWRTYASMLDRCTYDKNISYPNYGGRGITICARWLESFENFLVDMGERPEDKTLDRINPDGNYEPNNCRWATNAEQAANKRPHTVWNKGLKMPFKPRAKRSKK